MWPNFLRQEDISHLSHPQAPGALMMIDKGRGVAGGVGARGAGAAGGGRGGSSRGGGPGHLSDATEGLVKLCGLLALVGSTLMLLAVGTDFWAVLLGPGFVGGGHHHQQHDNHHHQPDRHLRPDLRAHGNGTEGVGEVWDNGVGGASSNKGRVSGASNDNRGVGGASSSEWGEAPAGLNPACELAHVGLWRACHTWTRGDGAGGCGHVTFRGEFNCSYFRHFSRWEEETGGFDLTHERGCSLVAVLSAVLSLALMGLGAMGVGFTLYRQQISLLRPTAVAYLCAGFLVLLSAGLMSSCISREAAVGVLVGGGVGVDVGDSLPLPSLSPSQAPPPLPRWGRLYLAWSLSSAWASAAFSLMAGAGYAAIVFPCRRRRGSMDGVEGGASH
ncbi:voltage-dependent calcium channel gamma-6 subunit-like [Lethenteron reissneri]|uniref:voltage-dependent calcium channel gamma-6 subunit-like n=1 Tax=Lethenteron reissneri TaxID=7753 RepID=UPI002AB7BF87|nr:voltage-dependent calcium channel gamma-6 subunit-like [Lethenteron reissneri]